MNVINNDDYVPPLRRQNTMVIFKRTKDFEKKLVKCLVNELEAKRRQEIEQQPEAKKTSDVKPGNIK